MAGRPDSSVCKAFPGLSNRYVVPSNRPNSTGASKSTLRFNISGSPLLDDIRNCAAYNPWPYPPARHDPRISGPDSPLVLLPGSRRGRFGLTRDVEFLLRVKELETLANLQFLGGRVVLQAIDIILLTLDLSRESVVALFHFLDLALLVLPGAYPLGKGKEGVAHRHQEYKHISESGQWRFHATIEPEDNISINTLR